MSFITLLLLALSLSADAFAVAVGTGISQEKIHKKQAIFMALTFGFFQALMPIIGFYLASLFAHSIINFDHWIAFILLGYIGGNMIREWWKNGDKNNIGKNIFSVRSLLVLGIATSIDALAIWISLIASTDNIFFPAALIGVVTFMTTYLGVNFGKKFAKHLGSRAEIIGWLVLIGIGTKILIEHLMV